MLWYLTDRTTDKKNLKRKNEGYNRVCISRFFIISTKSISWIISDINVIKSHVSDAEHFAITYILNFIFISSFFTIQKCFHTQTSNYHNFVIFVVLETGQLKFINEILRYDDKFLSQDDTAAPCSIIRLIQNSNSPIDVYERVHVFCRKKVALWKKGKVQYDR